MDAATFLVLMEPVVGIEVSVATHCSQFQDRFGA